MSSKVTSKEILARFYVGRRLSYDGSLCTVRWIGQLSGTKAEWVGVEWDDSNRGKHDGTHQGERIFHCVCKRGKPASFIRPTRNPDPQRTVTEAIKFKYGGTSSELVSESAAVVISGKVAEEIGFAKIAQEQAQLSELKIVLIDQLVVNGLAPRGSGQEMIGDAQHELSRICPNIQELDLGFNVIEKWQDVADICIALPKLSQLRLGGLRFSSFSRALDSNPFTRIVSLSVNECLVSDSNISELLTEFKQLETLNLCGNGLDSLSSITDTAENRKIITCASLKTLYLDNNKIPDLDCILHISKAFPNANKISLGSNHISSLGRQILSSKQTFPQISVLNIQDNQIASMDFLDALLITFPRLTSLRVSGNPFYTVQTGDSDPKASDKLFYLSLARIPTLTQLNYGKISGKDREEGEIYYLSVVGQDIRDLLTSTAMKTKSKEKLESEVNALYPRYLPLCQKYARESTIDQFFSSLTTSTSTEQTASQQVTVYPAGSLGARLVTATFYIPSSHAVSSPTLTKQLPLSLPVSSLMAYLRETPTFSAYLAPLQFNMIFESTEFDPVDTTADSSTRSKMFAGGHRLTKEEKENLWKEWGDWDADALLEEVRLRKAGGDGNATVADGIAQSAGDEHWTEDGFLMRDGRKWKRREVAIPHSVRRPWGDWIDIEGGGPEREVKVRIEPFERPNWRV